MCFLLIPAAPHLGRMDNTKGVGLCWKLMQLQLRPEEGHFRQIVFLVLTQHADENVTTQRKKEVLLDMSMLFGM